VNDYESAIYQRGIEVGLSQARDQVLEIQGERDMIQEQFSQLETMASSALNMGERYKSDLEETTTELDNVKGRWGELRDRWTNNQTAEIAKRRMNMKEEDSAKLEERIKLIAQFVLSIYELENSL
jgi:chromosome segregation ATPase